ncbi:chemotaxis protein CheW [Sphingomonas montana]|uniref:chemotaxis protein CheW n=1 Tax=Sphingomonas montana TaxID=1843236 RepID=UPI00096F4995|nr:chemotaxis protein CheW [Sphingomonas montana]
METTGPAMLICDVGPVRFALVLSDVVEILPIVPLWRPPTMPRPLVGFVMVRGETVAVLSPALLFDGDAAMPDTIDLSAHLVRVRGGAALLVDRADAIVTDPVVRAVTPDLSYRGCVTGMVDAGGGDAHVLSVPQLLADGAAARIAALTAEAARRGREWAA